jgi:Ni/Co efflux regulator RcnB
MFKRIATGLAAIVLCALAAPSHAGQGGVDVVFTDGEISIIRAWYRDQGTPRGGKGRNRGNKSLPPGIAKNLERGKPLPPGIARQSLPAGLIGRLPPPPAGYERVVLSGKVLLVEIATQVIHDVLEDLVLGN